MKTNPRKKITRKDIASKLKIIRESMGWTQSEMAAHLGISQASISKLENARADMTASHWLDFCRSAGVSSDIAYDSTMDRMPRKRSVA